MKHFLIFSFLLLFSAAASAQIGEHRNTLSVGVGGGWGLTTVRFTPKVEQSMKGGFTGGLSVRYTVEKYFSTIASIAAELNYSQLGWKEDIRDIDGQPVINGVTGQAEAYERTVSYLQVPLLAHLAWGREQRGCNFFINLGPQFGWYLGESTQSNFKFDERNTADRASQTCAQDTMAVENRLDYGITAGLGVEYDFRHAGRFLLEARYYYGLGNIYGDSKRDYFGSSNYSTISVRLAWLFDILH